MAPSWRWARLTPFTTTVDTTGEAPLPKKKREDPRARVTISSVGRKIHQRHLQVISETGVDLGTMHRADVLRLMDERGLKLVPLNENKDPPVYSLMSGKQLHEEQLKLRDKQKTQGGPVQVKELKFSSDIAAHDLLTKLKQVKSWLDKKHHIKITLKAGRVEPTQQLDGTLEQIVQQMEVPVGFVSRPKVTRDGRYAVCVVRLPSAKELSSKGQNKTPGAPSPVPPPDSPTDT